MLKIWFIRIICSIVTKFCYLYNFLVTFSSLLILYSRSINPSIDPTIPASQTPPVDPATPVDPEPMTKKKRKKKRNSAKNEGLESEKHNADRIAETPVQKTEGSTTENSMVCSKIHRFIIFSGCIICCCDL